MPEDVVHPEDRFIANLLPDSKNSVMGSYVLIAEIVTDGHVELRVAVSDGLAPWAATGMLDAGMEVVKEVSNINRTRKEGDDPSDGYNS